MLRPDAVDRGESVVGAGPVCRGGAGHWLSAGAEQSSTSGSLRVPGRFRLKRLDKPLETREELNERIAEILAEGFYSYLLRKGLLKLPDTESLLARIDELKKTRPDYDKL